MKRLANRLTLISGGLISLVTFGAWIGRLDLHSLVVTRPAALPAVMMALPVLLCVMGLALWSESNAQRALWVRRTQRLSGLPRLAEEPVAMRWWRRLPDPLEWLTRPVLDSGWGRSFDSDWREAGLGGKPSRGLLLIVGVSLAGWLFGARIAGPVLASAFLLVAPVAPMSAIRSMAESTRRRYDDQLPMALDAMAAGLSAGLSFPQAVHFSAGELPEPMSGVMARISRRLQLGVPVEKALQALPEARLGEMMVLAVEGIALQRQFGGDLIRMLNETADLLRERLELDREVRAVSSQGRLSGAVVAALVPVSAGLLLATNPAYIDVLFDTLIGQVLLVAAILLQLAGWGVLSRLVRIEY